MSRSPKKVMAEMELSIERPPQAHVALLLSDALVAALQVDNIEPQNYRPAYGGESVGLDLYNAGPKIVIPPMEKLSKYAELEAQEELENLATWLDYPERARKLVAKQLMPTGIKSVISEGYGAFVYGRGSVTKTPVTHRAGVIDPGYTGEIFVNIINVSKVPYVLEAGAKSPFQLVVQKVTTNFTTVTAERFKELSSNATRQAGKIGSSD